MKDLSTDELQALGENDFTKEQIDNFINRPSYARTSRFKMFKPEQMPYIQAMLTGDSLETLFKDLRDYFNNLDLARLTQDQVNQFINSKQFPELLIGHLYPEQAAALVDRFRLKAFSKLSTVCVQAIDTGRWTQDLVDRFVNQGLFRELTLQKFTPDQVAAMVDMLDAECFKAIFDPYRVIETLPDEYTNAIAIERLTSSQVDYIFRCADNFTKLSRIQKLTPQQQEILRNTHGVTW